MKISKRGIENIDKNSMSITTYHVYDSIGELLSLSTPFSSLVYISKTKKYMKRLISLFFELFPLQLANPVQECNYV